MARQLKPQFVENFRHATGVTVDIYLNRNNLKFYADYNDDTYTAESLDAVKRLVTKAISAHQNLYWFPVIQIKRMYRGDSGNSANPFIGIDVDRYYVARADDGKLFMTYWNIGTHPKDEDEQAARTRQAQSFHQWSPHLGTFNPPCNDNQHMHMGDNPYNIPPTNVFMPYTEALWRGLLELIVMIGNLKKKLDLLLGSSEGMLMISQVGANTLAGLLGGFNDDANLLPENEGN